MKTIKGWKVILFCRKSLYPISPVIYNKNEWTFPTLKHSKLFFFKNMNDAIRFSNRDHEIVVPCIATNSKRITRVPSINNTQTEFEIFWERRHSKKSLKGIQTAISPKGTCVADSIKCLE